MPINFRFLKAPSRPLLILSCLLLALLIAGCASNPLGMSDQEWERLSPEQQLEARKEDQRLSLERERLRVEERKRKQEEQRQRDLAEGMILEYSPDAPYCIGGDRCPRDQGDALILSLRRLADVDKVVFFADDNIGGKHDGMLSVYADSVLVAEHIDVKRRGQWHQVLVGRPARNIALRAEGDDEVEIGQVKIYGSWATGERQYLIIK